MIQIQRKEDCSGCGACYSACPNQCISMNWDEEGFYYPVVDQTQCVECGICEKVCPIQNPPLMQHFEQKAFAVINRDESIRRQSSSGGIFTLLAQRVLAEGGAVFGAAYDENLMVHHICVRNAEQLSRLRVSKYVQSAIGDTYYQARELLTAGEKVLFTGTPCQIAGLYCFLGREYESLITHDIVCHGVPSPKVWEIYLNYEERKNGKRPTLVLRSKAVSWKNWHILIQYSDGSSRTEPHNENLFFRSFLANLCLRPSCHDCSFKGYERVSDLTLADLWGIEKVCPQMDDGKGTSLVLVHSLKGENALKQIEDSIKMAEVDVTAALKSNPSALQSSAVHPKRSDFFTMLQTQSFADVVDKCLKKSFLRRVKSKVFHLFRGG